MCVYIELWVKETRYYYGGNLVDVLRFLKSSEQKKTTQLLSNRELSAHLYRRMTKTTSI